MSIKPLIPKRKIDEKKQINMVNSFDELTAENDEIIASIESLRETNSAINTGYSEIMSSIRKLNESLSELAILTR
jgi:uncharacterized coiled-coil DUF342 family protein